MGECGGVLELGSPFLFVIDAGEESVSNGVYPGPVDEEVDSLFSRVDCFGLEW